MFLRWLLLVYCVAWSKATGILYPRESETREVKSLDGIWNFRVSVNPGEGVKNRWYAQKLSKSGATIPMPVPSSYNDITQEKSIREHVGVVWYERTFFVPHSWRDNSLRVWLRFGSVHYTANVWVNGQEVLFHEIGHLPFQTEITSVLDFGQENRLTVAVDNTLRLSSVPQGTLDKIQTNDGPKIVQRYTFDFFNYAGIHRTVHIYTTPAVYVDDISVYTDIQPPKGIVYFNISFGGLSLEGNEVTCWVDLLDADGDPVSRAGNSGKDSAGFTGKLEVQNANFWWPFMMHQDPGYLYTLEVRLETVQWGLDIVDVYRLPVGIRTVRYTNTSLLINNKPVYLRGFGRHEDSNLRGKGLDLVLVAKDYNLLKWVGANAFRTSHYPYAEEIMDFADKEGFMIIDECPSVDTDKFSDLLLAKHKQSLTELIQRDKNRPSVIMWSVANEPRTQHPAAAEYFRNVVSHVKSVDSRPVTSALAQRADLEYGGQFLDVIGFNRYNGWYSEPGRTDVIRLNVESEAKEWHLKHNKPVIMMEYGADTMPGLHFHPQYIWSEEYQIELFSEHFKAFDNLRNKFFFIGEMIWNFADFKTNQAITRVGGNKKGIFTRERQPKGAATHVRKRYIRLAQEIDNFKFNEELEPYSAPFVSHFRKNRVEL
ncbi:beta-glucuronidase-like isoform X2 [Rhodnius prolixus]|uniref:Beta-glucuronidase n=1 Tax=Rhodnius prolixus TaxID=13249 RepID=T1HP51_RHOPR